MNALIVTDVQHDFMPDGALGVPGADEIIPIINRLMPCFDFVFATQDWHPLHHVSFAETHHKKPKEVIQIGSLEQILWPVHCVQNTWGAALAEGLDRKRIQACFHKGVDPQVDSYSTFFDGHRKRATGLAERLRELSIQELAFVGLATDYCVLYSVLDALELGFRATLIQDACRAINLHPEDEKRAIEKMRQKGAKIALSKDFLDSSENR